MHIWDFLQFGRKTIYVLKTLKQKINVLALGYVIFNSQAQVVRQQHFWPESVLFYLNDRCI